MIGEVATFAMYSGGGGARPDDRFLQARALEIGHEQYANEVIVPTCQRQGTKFVMLGSPWGWSAKPNGDPVDRIELDARRMCWNNPRTNVLANVDGLRKGLTVLKKSGLRTGIYMGTPFAPDLEHIHPWDQFIQAVVMPFADLVDVFCFDEGSEYFPGDRFDQAKLYIERHSKAEVWGEPRRLRKPYQQLPLKTVCIAEKWKISGREGGDTDHLPLNLYPPGAAVYIIDGGDSPETHAGWLAKGANVMLGLWSQQTRSQLIQLAGQLVGMQS